MFSYSQSDFEKVIKSVEIIVNGLSFLKGNESETKSTNSKVIESVCVKNKLRDKITFSLVGKDQDGNTIKKEGEKCVLKFQEAFVHIKLF